MFGNLRAWEVLSPLFLLFTLLLGVPRPSAGQTVGPVRQRPPQSPFLGSVPTGQATGTSLDLSLKEAFDRALNYNLAVIESSQSIRAAHAVRLRSLSALLPNLSARVSATLEQINLKALGFKLNFPGVYVPSIIGPFGVADARAYVSQQIFNWSDIKNLKSAAESERASSILTGDRDSNTDDRERLSSCDF
jgi:outer membrane protein TolC